VIEIKMLQFLVETAERHPDPNYAFASEVPTAEALAKLGWLRNEDDAGHPGCYSMTSAGEGAITLLELQIAKTELPSAPSPPPPEARKRSRKSDTPKP
jgi:hypothetical protein